MRLPFLQRSVYGLIKAQSNRRSKADIFLRDDRETKSNRMEQSVFSQIGSSFCWLGVYIPSGALPGKDSSLGLHSLFHSLSLFLQFKLFLFGFNELCIFPFLMRILEFRFFFGGGTKFLITFLFHLCERGKNQLFLLDKADWNGMGSI